MATPSVIRKAPRLHQKPKGQPAIRLQPSAVQLTAEEMETLRKIASGVETLKIIAEQGHDIEIGELISFIEPLNDQAWTLWWELWRREQTASKAAAQGGVR